MFAFSSGITEYDGGIANPGVRVEKFRHMGSYILS